ncbi:hypothetical protein [Nocardia sp. NPDC059229]|uniref:hypothetical protein n=1 Tax=Nocardia sp. NPDC059229 TaxID=3346778 RepID=UPI003690A0C1
MTTASAPVSNSHTRSRRIPKWDKVITGLCLVLAFATAIWLTLATVIESLAVEQCKHDSSCVDQVDHGINVSISGTVAVLVIGLVCVIIAGITRTWLFIWALATLLLLPVPGVIGSDIVKHATEHGTIEPSRP